MILPNFLIIGAAKAGTTSLYHYLRQHPQIFMSEWEEPRYFACHDRGAGRRRTETPTRHAVATIEEYCRLFERANGATAIGEASTLYLYSEIAPRNIRRTIPDVRLITVLRNPADRAYSHFRHGLRDGWEPHRDFRQALAEEEWRIAHGWGPQWHYVRRGRYAAQLKRYLTLFGREQLAVYLFEDLSTDPLRLVQRIFDLLEVDAAFRPSVAARHNASWVPRSRPLEDALRGRNRIGRSIRGWLPESVWKRYVPRMRELNRAWPPLDAELRNHLIEVLREDILELQDLIDRDLTNWLEPR